MPKLPTQIPPEQLEAYDRLIASNSKIERKGKTMPYTSFNGHMFSHLDKTGAMGLRLSPEDREVFLKKYNARIFEQHGRQMKEYVEIPDSLLLETDKLLPYLNQSLNYIIGLKPKPAKKSKH